MASWRPDIGRAVICHYLLERAGLFASFNSDDASPRRRRRRWHGSSCCIQPLPFWPEAISRRRALHKLKIREPITRASVETFADMVLGLDVAGAAGDGAGGRHSRRPEPAVEPGFISATAGRVRKPLIERLC